MKLQASHGIFELQDVKFPCSNERLPPGALKAQLGVIKLSGDILCLTHRLMLWWSYRRFHLAK